MSSRYVVKREGAAAGWVYRSVTDVVTHLVHSLVPYDERDMSDLRVARRELFPRHPNGRSMVRLCTVSKQLRYRKVQVARLAHAALRRRSPKLRFGPFVITNASPGNHSTRLKHAPG